MMEIADKPRADAGSLVLVVSERSGALIPKSIVVKGAGIASCSVALALISCIVFALFPAIGVSYPLVRRLLLLLGIPAMMFALYHCLIKHDFLAGSIKAVKENKQVFAHIKQQLKRYITRLDRRLHQDLKQLSIHANRMLQNCHLNIGTGPVAAD